MDAATVAGRIILTNPRARRWAAWAAALAAGLIALPIVVLLAVVIALSSSPAPDTVGTADGIPAVYAPMYQAAGAAYHVDPYVLAALHKTESDYSMDPAAFHPNSAGALGPMQFLPSTWAGYANAYRPIAAQRPAHYPHMCTPHGCITDDYDAISAAADYLHQLGADGEPRSAHAERVDLIQGHPARVDRTRTGSVQARPSNSKPRTRPAPAR